MVDNRSSTNLPELGEGRVFVGKCESIHSPRFRIWINLRRFDKSAADLESIAPTNANYLVTGTWFRAASPSLFVNCGIALPSDLPIVEAVPTKLLWQRPVETSFLTTSLSPGARFLSRAGQMTPRDTPRSVLPLTLPSSWSPRFVLGRAYRWVVGSC